MFRALASPQSCGHISFQVCSGLGSRNHAPAIVAHSCVCVCSLALVTPGCDRPRASSREACLFETAGSGSIRSDFQFEHTLPPVIAEESPDYAVAVPVVNRTQDTVSFDRVSPSCNCSGARLTNSTLAAGEETTLHMSINLRGRSGLQRVGVTLFEPSGRSWLHVIEVTVFPRARFSVTDDILPFGYPEPGDPVERTFALELFANDRDSLPNHVGVTTDDPALDPSRPSFFD